MYNEYPIGNKPKHKKPTIQGLIYAKHCRTVFLSLLILDLANIVLHRRAHARLYNILIVILLVELDEHVY